MWEKARQVDWWGQPRLIPILLTAFPPVSLVLQGGSSDASAVLPQGSLQAGGGSETRACEAFRTNTGGGDHSFHRFEEKETGVWVAVCQGGVACRWPS